MPLILLLDSFKNTDRLRNEDIINSYSYSLKLINTNLYNYLANYLANNLANYLINYMINYIG